MDNDLQRPNTPIEEPKPIFNQPQKNDLAPPSSGHNVFQTPEDIANQDNKTELGNLNVKPSKMPRKHWWDKLLSWWHALSKKQQIIYGSVLAVIVIGCLSAVLILTHHKPKHVITKSTIQIFKPVSTTVPSTLTGLPVSPSQNQLPVTGIMIENSDGARPQSGLSQAGVVFEALAEGGVTRFLAMYQDNQSYSIGPVRSARPYFIDWLLPFNAGYAHVGGSPAALSEIQSLNVRDMNQFYNSGSYSRVSSKQAPHNVYTTLPSLLSLEQSKGWSTSSFVSFARKPDSPSKTATAAAIALNISYADMNVSYQYNPKTNSYERSEAGAAMVDANTNLQLNPKVVVAMVVPWANGPVDATGAYYTNYSDIGSGVVDIFQDGTITQGVWAKSSPSSQLQFNTASGQTIKLDAGQTWITAMGSASLIQYQP